MKNWWPTWLRRAGWMLAILLLATGCATSRPVPGPRAFEFGKDTFAYANELVWEYHFDQQTKKRTTTKREPEPEYTLQCFVVARSAKQFFFNARFAPELAKVEAEEYRRLVAAVVDQSPRAELAEGKRIVIPGYADLTSFSAEHGQLLKEECGGAWQSYIQRGHWRMLLPFSRRHQERAAKELAASLQVNRPAVVHVVMFPQLSINHAVLVYAVTESEKEMVFSVYDPNEPVKSTTLTYDRQSRTFSFPTNLYFQGGRVDVYEIYRGWLY